MTIGELAELANVSVRTVAYALDDDRRVTRAIVAAAFARVLGCHVDAFSTPADPAGTSSVCCDRCGETIGTVPRNTARTAAPRLHRKHRCTPAPVT